MNCNTYPPNRNIDKLSPKFKEKVQRFLADNPEIFVTEASRSAHRQSCLLRTGASRIARSRHQDGMAIDIAFHGDELYPPVTVWDNSIGKKVVNPQWRKVANSAKDHGMNWGYDLWAHTGFIDATHFEDDGVPLLERSNEDMVEDIDVNNNDKNDEINDAKEVDISLLLTKFQHLEKLLKNTTEAYGRVMDDVRGITNTTE